MKYYLILLFMILISCTEKEEQLKKEKGIKVSYHYDIGGGEERKLVYQVNPEFNLNLKSSLLSNYRIEIFPEGSIGRVIPLKKTAPIIENKCIKAIKQWRFNPIMEDKRMFGVISITVIVS